MTTSPPSRHLVERAVEALGQARPLEPRPAPSPDRTEAGAQQTATAPGAVEPPRAARPPAPPPPPITLEMLRRAGFVAGMPGGTRNKVSEEISIVQNQVLRTAQSVEAGDGRIPRMVMITSAKPGEGKTFCSLNIAVRLAMSAPEQVILVDGDSKREGGLTNLLGLDGSSGLRLLATDFPRRPETLVVPTALNRLFFMPYGVAASDAAGLPSGAMLAGALTRLAAAMPGRIIIVDAPPCLSASEPSALAATAGQVVMVVRAESTQRHEVEGALDLVDACPNLQLLLNATRLLSPDTFGAYGYDAG